MRYYIIAVVSFSLGYFCCALMVIARGRKKAKAGIDWADSAGYIDGDSQRQ